MTYRIVEILMILSAFQDHAPNVGLLKSTFVTVLQQLLITQSLFLAMAVPLRPLRVFWLTD